MFRAAVGGEDDDQLELRCAVFDAIDAIRKACHVLKLAAGNDNLEDAGGHDMTNDS